MHGRRGATIAMGCALAVGGTSALAATVVRPGARSNPVPIGQEATVRENWLMKIVSVTPRAGDLVRRASKGSQGARVPAGKQDYLVRLSVMYVGSGRGVLATSWITSRRSAMERSTTALRTAVPARGLRRASKMRGISTER